MRRILATILLLTLGASACGDTSPSVPTPAPLNLTGTWTGDVSLQGAPTRMTWTVTHTNNSVDGPVLVLLPNAWC